MPGLIQATVNWYKIYKTPFGSLPNKVAFGGELKDQKFTCDIIGNVHQHWKKLMHTKSENINIERSCTIYDSPFMISQKEASNSVNSHSQKGEDKPYDTDVNKWHYIKNNL